MSTSSSSSEGTDHPLANMMTSLRKEQDEEFDGMDWADFKADVNLKDLISEIDRGIDKRNRQIEVVDENSIRIKKLYTRFEPLLKMTMVVYVGTPFLAKPGWCVNNPDIPQSGPGALHCTPYSGITTIPHSNLPYL